MTALRAGKRQGTARELAKRLGVTERTIRSYAAQPRDEYIRDAQVRQEKIRELRKTGLSMRAIAAELGCSVGTVHRALKEQPAA